MQWKCLLGEYRAPLLAVAAVWAASQYDSFQLPWDLGGPPPYDEQRLAYAETVRSRTRQTLQAIRSAQPAAAGVFTARFAHCVSQDAAAWSAAAPDAGGGGRGNVTLVSGLAYALSAGRAAAPWGVDSCDGFDCGRRT